VARGSRERGARSAPADLARAGSPGADRGSLRAGGGLFSGAASLLTPMLEEARRAELERLRGECLYYGGQPEAAARAFAAALAHCPPGERAEHARILRSRAYMQARANDWRGRSAPAGQPYS